MRAGGEATVRVAVATLWSTPEAVRPIDSRALGRAADMSAWVAAMTPEQQLGDAVLSQLLLGETVQIDEVRPDGWARVVALQQPAATRDRRGYPGWMPTDQLLPRRSWTYRSEMPDLVRAKSMIDAAVASWLVVDVAETALHTSRDGTVGLAGVVLGTCLCAAGAAVDGWWPVWVPGEEDPMWVRDADVAEAPEGPRLADGSSGPDGATCRDGAAGLNAVALDAAGLNAADLDAAGLNAAGLDGATGPNGAGLDGGAGPGSGVGPGGVPSSAPPATADGSASRPALPALGGARPAAGPVQPARDAALPALGAAARFRGVAYVWGGVSAHGIDCSGLVHLVWRRFGVTLPRDAADQAEATSALPLGAERPGDLYFFQRPGRRIHHVGIVTSEPGQPRAMLHASFTDRRVVEEPLSAERAATLVAAHRV